MLLNIGIFTICAVNNCCQDALLCINQIQFRIFYIELSAQCFNYGIDEIRVFVNILILRSPNESHLNKMLQILAQYLYSVIFRNGLFPNIETFRIHLVQLQLK